MNFFANTYSTVKENATSVLFSALGIFLAAILFHFTFSAPSDFPTGKLLSIDQGTSVGGIASVLKEGGVIRSEFVFKVFVRLFGTNLKAGDYSLNRKQSVYSIASRLLRGEYGLTPVRVTIPEGLNVNEIGNLLAQNLYHFDKKKFTELAADYEGYLFPDTYFFLPTVKPDEIIRIMNLKFQDSIKSISPDIQKSGHKLADIVTMASIIEEECTASMMRKVSGILWKRISIGMPLQVDSTFVYVNGKRKSSDITVDDLKINSPYNTYTNRGLPPTPISNPGLMALKAAINPESSPYFFYLTDSKGVAHYAASFDEHIENKFRYIK